MSTPIQRFIWDLTYACPLRCTHCYSESGRRPASTLSREDMLRIVDVIIRARPQRISLSGGEPLLAPWWAEAARRLREAEIPVTIFTSGWLMDEDTAHDLARTVTSVCVSVDGAAEETHDRIRGRRGSFRNAMAALEVLDRVRRERTERGEGCYTFGVDFTVTRSNQGETERFVEDMTGRFPSLAYVRFGAVIPEGLAQEEAFEEQELLSEQEVQALKEAEPRLAARARHGIGVSVTDVRYFLPYSPLGAAGLAVAHIEADGQLRAFGIYEAKVGNVLREPLDVLWQRAIAWRNDPFVDAQLRSIQTIRDWARVTRTLDRRYGSDADKARIALRGKVAEPRAAMARGVS